MNSLKFSLLVVIFERRNKMSQYSAPILTPTLVSTSLETLDATDRNSHASSCASPAFEPTFDYPRHTVAAELHRVEVYSGQNLPQLEMLERTHLDTLALITQGYTQKCGLEYRIAEKKREFEEMKAKIKREDAISKQRIAHQQVLLELELAEQQRAFEQELAQRRASMSVAAANMVVQDVKPIQTPISQQRAGANANIGVVGQVVKPQPQLPRVDIPAKPAPAPKTYSLKEVEALGAKGQKLRNELQTLEKTVHECWRKGNDPIKLMEKVSNIQGLIDENDKEFGVAMKNLE
jgi:hypothetical protein